jgi:hypothetical protein
VRFSRDVDAEYVLMMVGSEVVKDSTPIPQPDYEALIAQIADDILAEHTPARIMQVRAKLYDLLAHCIPATTILKVGVLALGSYQ